MTADNSGIQWLSADPIASSLIRAGEREEDAFAASERVAIQREGRPLNEMADAIMANREIERMRRCLVIL